MLNKNKKKDKANSCEESTSLHERDRRYVEVYRSTGNHRQAVRSYCAGNKWATANAKATGNW
jgi:hypothetical protein